MANQRKNSTPKFYKINTIGDGFHAGKPIELTMQEFYIGLGEAFERLVFVGADLDIVSWYQFRFHDDDQAGIAYFWQK